MTLTRTVAGILCVAIALFAGALIGKAIPGEPFIERLLRFAILFAALIGLWLYSRRYHQKRSRKSAAGKLRVE
jgi:hypothetical protein